MKLALGLLILLLASTVHAAQITSRERALMTVEMLKPMDPAAREHGSKEERQFEAAKRMVAADLAALFDAAPAQQEKARARLASSLALLGDVGGYSRPGLAHARSWSLQQYRTLQLLAQGKQKAAQKTVIIYRGPL